MPIVDEMRSLQEERAAIILQLQALRAEAQQIKNKHLNAQNEVHQRRIDAEHRVVSAKCYRLQDELTNLNARIKLLASKLHKERASARRLEG